MEKKPFISTQPVLTWRQLAVIVSKMTDEQADSDLTIHASDDKDEEIYMAELAIAGKEHGVLDEGHPYLTIRDSLKKTMREE